MENEYMGLPDDHLIKPTEDDYDILTHCFNRSFFWILFENELKNAKNNDLPLSLFAINIDNFKYINDTYGHNRGNNALITIASLIKDGLGVYNSLFRYGGDNFNAILPKTGLKEAQRIADIISQSIADHSFFDDIHLTISLGVAELQSKNESTIEIFIRADQNLYAAKYNKKTHVK
jgi:diguanylate cyclase (GGDEF)-like protein